MMPRHGCVYCGKYFFSESKLSSHTLFFHGKWKPDKILPKQSWASRERALYESTKMENQIKRQELKIVKIKATKKFRDARNRRWNSYRSILQFELMKLEAMKKSLILLQRESRGGKRIA
tara:strand:- start:1664 stop:2020 length:357 start_codon:yes stop_codon:yes gene_type:complete